MERTDFYWLILSMLLFLTVKDDEELITFTLLPLKFHKDFKWIMASSLSLIIQKEVQVLRLRLVYKKCKTGRDF